MPGVENHSPRKGINKSLHGVSTSNFLRLPSTIRNLFDAFPWFTYHENVLPQRAASRQPVNTLHVFVPKNGKFSPNPACLKWQAYLMIKGVPFVTVDSNNHASPTGALPFILPARNSTEPQPLPITSSKIQRWVETQTSEEEPDNAQDRVLMSLIEQNIRSAWLFFIYLKPDNFQSIAHALYITTASKNMLVQKTLAYELRQAAAEEIIKSSSRIDEAEILTSIERAFKALNQILREHDFFSKSQDPGVLDCAIFSYTYLITKFAQPAEKAYPQWIDKSLYNILSKYTKLVEHNKRMEYRCTTQE